LEEQLFEHATHPGENKKAVIGSPIIAKAILTNPDGKCKIVVVFQNSTRQEFYWVFHARSPRSPRRSWKIASYHPRDFAFKQKAYWDFSSFVSYYSSFYCLKVSSEKVFHKKRLSTLKSKTEHESILADWKPQDPKSVCQDRCRERALRLRTRRWAW
jgi:hypothetical protein